jgi:tyrosyl-tRNA synthetase
MTNDILTRRVAKVLPTKEGLWKLMEKKKIKLFQGFDPTGGRLHLGHSLGIRKLMDFAKAGHEVIFLFGTGTVLVGDPSQRDTGRKLITEEEIKINIQGWKNQVSPLVEWEKIKTLQNGDWLTKMKLADIVKVASNISAVQLFKRESFQRRIDRGDTVWYHETMYPLLQGYDSVVMDVDLEIGGTDQEFNMLVGRELQKKMNNREKYVLTTPMIVGTDGKQMSKSSGNCVWLDDSPIDMFGKLMGLSDEHIVTYMELITSLPMDRVIEVKTKLKENTLHPMDAKKELAFTVVSELHSKKDAQKAQEYFEKTFQKGNAPDEIQITAKAGTTILEAVANQTGSNTEAKRLLGQNAVKLNTAVSSDPNTTLKANDIIKIGKKTFIRVE